jgi:hypothetical protein
MFEHFRRDDDVERAGGAGGGRKKFVPRGDVGEASGGDGAGGDGVWTAAEVEDRGVGMGDGGDGIDGRCEEADVAFIVVRVDVAGVALRLRLVGRLLVRWDKEEPARMATEVPPPPVSLRLPHGSNGVRRAAAEDTRVLWVHNEFILEI